MSNESTRQAVGRGRAFWMKKIPEFEREPCTHAEFIERHGLMLRWLRLPGTDPWRGVATRVRCAVGCAYLVRIL